MDIHSTTFAAATVFFIEPVFLAGCEFAAAFLLLLEGIAAGAKLNSERGTAELQNLVESFLHIAPV